MSLNLNLLLLAEVDREAASTRRVLERIPDEHFGWKPHEKSMTLGRLATHVAELPLWINRILDTDDFDFGAQPYQPVIADNREGLLSFFEDKLQAGRMALGLATDEQLAQTWVFRRGEYVIGKDVRYQMLRQWMLNHQVHHRGQLTVYLRLLDIPVPGLYGPSADERPAPRPVEASKG